VRLVPEAIAPRRDRETLSWPRSLSEAGYRIGNGAVRTTALDRSVPEGDSFRLEGDDGRFVVDVPRGPDVRLHLERPEPSLSDTLDWGTRRIDLRGAPTQVIWRLDSTVGVDLGTHWLVPLRVSSRGARVTITPW
jgi:arylamine N-acetyltransferase